MNPTITPVLDLTQLTQDAKQIPSLIDTTTVTPTLTLDIGSVIADELSITAKAKDADRSGTPSIPAEGDSYTQNIYSPTPLSPLAVYQDTKGLLNMRKGKTK